MASVYFFRIDLTEEKRYTIKPATKQLLNELDDEVFVEVYLAGELNPGFKRFQKSILETLEEFKIYSHNKVQFTVTDPATAASEKARNEFQAGLAQKGVSGMRVIDTNDGERVEKIVFPGAVISYGGFENGVMLFKSKLATTSQEVLNQSIEGVEFELANAIHKIINVNRKKIGLVMGHGELDSLKFASFNNALFEQYNVFKVNLAKKKSILNYNALIIAKPMRVFSEPEKLSLDQYIMNGGKVLFLLDRMEANMDSASLENYFARSIETNLEDQLFKYGVRINQDLVQDRFSAKYPVVIGKVSDRPEIMQMEWPFFPLINHYTDNSITKNMDATLLRFASSIDTVKVIGVKKTPLLFTSQFTRKLGNPIKVGIDDLRKTKPESFVGGQIPLAYLLEGQFTSLYKNRFLPEGTDSTGFKSSSKPTKLIVVADGDIARNEVNPRTNQAQLLGKDVFSGYTYSNQDLLLNMVAYLTDENGLITARTKEVKIRPLDKEKLKKERVYWQSLNLVVPIVLLVIFGILRAMARKRKYASF
jgi:gliding-associated putative ABC transporter substrate-binding component GldG